MQTLGEDLLTVAEAAAELRVGRSTIRRWIRRGDVPAYRVGQRRVALKRADLAALITPATAIAENGGNAARPVPEASPPLTPEQRRQAIPRLTPEQQRQGLEALESAKCLQAEILARRGGKLFSPSWELLNEARDERSRELS